MSDTATLNQLLTRRDVWRGRSASYQGQVISSGCCQLDTLLQGGWPAGALTELLSEHQGIGELRLLLPTLARMKTVWQVWLNPPYIPYAPMLARAGVSLQHMLVVHPKNHREWIWAAEQSLHSGALLLAWAGQSEPRYAELRKLQLAAATGGRCAFLFRNKKALVETSPAALRLLLSNEGQQLQLEIAKLRGQPTGKRLQRQPPDILRQQPALKYLSPLPHLQGSRARSSSAHHIPASEIIRWPRN